GVILAAVYMLGMVQRVFFGPLTNPKNKLIPDLTRRETLALAPLVLLVFLIGFFPNVLLDRIKDSVGAHLAQFNRVGALPLEADGWGVRLLPAEVFSPAFLKGAPEIGPKPSPPAGDAPAPQARVEAP